MTIRAILRALVAIALALAITVVNPAASATADVPPVCTPVAFIGARGSDEPSGTLGAELQATFEALRDQCHSA